MVRNTHIYNVCSLLDNYFKLKLIVSKSAYFPVLIIKEYQVTNSGAYT